MVNNFSRNLPIKQKGLGAYQIVGGTVGLVLTVWLLAEQASVPGLLVLLFLVAIGLYSYSIYCGILMLKKNTNGFKHSLINQYLQLINFSIVGYAFKYISGVFFTVGVDLTGSINFEFNGGISTWQIDVNSHTEVISINFNLVALLLITFIGKMKEKQEKDNASVIENKLE